MEDDGSTGPTRSLMGGYTPGPGGGATPAQRGLASVARTPLRPNTILDEVKQVGPSPYPLPPNP